MIFKDPFHLFPSPLFSTVLFYLILGAGVIDWILPKLVRHDRSSAPTLVRDRWSYWLIQLTFALAVILSVALRLLHWGLTLPAVQYVGLVLIPLGLGLREWAIFKLGRFFSRVVEIEASHRLVTDGPYRWFRHPAYTGMVLIYLGIVLAFGTWLGTLVALILMLSATLYRIRIEEQVLVEAFGKEYREYMHRTWKLFPGW
jgi:protein-S-isoprenylcysteine O-methyltransferase Ste14